MTLRTAVLSASFLAVAACNTGYPAPPATADEQRRLASFIGDRTAGAPTRCIPYYSGMKIEAIGNDIVAEWGGRKWVNTVQGSCRMADNFNNILVTDSGPAGQYCENETFKVVSSSGGMIMGTCMLGPWTPYSR